MRAVVAHRQIICLAVNSEERDEVGIELVQVNAVAAQRADPARGFDDADVTSDQLASDPDDLLPVIERDDLGERHDT